MTAREWKAYAQGQLARRNGWERVSPYKQCKAQNFWYAGFDDEDFILTHQPK